MSAPIVFIFLPILFAVFLLFISKKGTLTSILAAASCLILALLAHFLPIDQYFLLGSTRVQISAAFSILGRQLILNDGNLPILVLMYSVGAFWFLGIRPARAPRLMAPLGLIMLALSAAALAVRPFLYAAIILEAMVLISIPLFLAPGQPAGRGILRYLIFMTLAVPFILLAGTLAGRVEVDPTQASLLNQVVVMLAIGFSIWLAVFPFNTWVPMLFEETPPFVAGFVLSLQSTIAFMMLLGFTNEFGWLRNHPDLPMALRSAGLVMIASAGIWAVFQKRLPRLFGYAIIVDNGMALLAFNPQDPLAMQIFAAGFLPRLLGIALLSLGLAVLRRSEVELSLEGVKGFLRKDPFTSLAILGGFFSMAGLPLLAEFPVRLVVFEKIAQISLAATLWMGVGILGILGACLQLTVSFIREDVVISREVERDWVIIVMLMLGMVMLIGMGLFPSLATGLTAPLL